MPYTISIDVAAPAQLYDAFHAALIKHTGGRVDGLLAHVGWATATGFRIIEVWTSKELCDRANQEVIPQVWATFMATAPAPPDAMPEQHLEELDTRGLVIPSAALAV